MNGTIPTSNEGWTFDLSSGPAKPKLANDGELVSLLGENDRWTQYENKTVYEIDCLVRQWIEENSKHSKWVKWYRYRRYTMKMVYEQIYAKPYVQSEAGNISYWLPKILSYYSTKIQRGGSILGKSYSKTIYTISPKRGKKAPYSLRLRLEWFAENDIMPTYSNMCLPKENLKPGHARNPRTDANMVARSERAKARYNERYNANRDR